MFWDTVVKPGDTDSKDSKIKVGFHFNFSLFCSYSAAQSFIHNMQPYILVFKVGFGDHPGVLEGLSGE